MKDHQRTLVGKSHKEYAQGALNFINRKKKLTTKCTWTTTNSLLKKKKEQELLETLGIYSQNIRIKYGIEKCAMQIMKRGK